MTRTNLNKVLKNILKNHKINEQNSKNSPYKTQIDYENSFNDILKFRSKFSLEQLQKINVVIYHDENNDGMSSAAIAWKFLTGDNDKTIKYIPLKPGKFVEGSYIKNKNVLVLDIDINKSKNMINNLEKEAESVIIIDDHGSLQSTNKLNVYAGQSSNKRMEHATVAYTWKFFYPQQPVPLFIQYIDSQDAKLYMPFTPHSDLVSDAIGFRLVHDKSIYKNRQTQPENILKDLWSIIDESNTSFWIFIGKYFAEVTENLKDQIAKNAVKRKFQGYCVGVINFNAPALAKKVGLQIISNFEAKGEPIDFAVTWGYEYTSNAYRIGLMRRPSLIVT